MFKKLILILFFVFSSSVYSEGTYEFRGKTSSNPLVKLDGTPAGNYAGDLEMGLRRINLFYVDIFDAQNEWIDLYTSNPFQDETGMDIAIWCPNNPHPGNFVNDYQTASKTYNFDLDQAGAIWGWDDIVAIQNINNRENIKPRIFKPSDYGCGNGVYTVRFYAHDPGAAYSDAIDYVDITVRDTNGTNKKIDDTLINGRVFSNHYSLILSGFNQYLDYELFVVTGEDNYSSYEGYVWKMEGNNIQPFGFHVLANDNGTYPEVYFDSSQPDFISPQPLMIPKYNFYLNYPKKPVYQPPTIPILSTVEYIDLCDINNNASGTDGGYFNFHSNGDWKYKLYADLNEDGQLTLNEKILYGQATKGDNSVYWDGRLPDGTLIPAGTELEFKLFLVAGEVHFPFYDVENQYTDQGPIIELISIPKTEASKKYYWNDAPLGGSASDVNGSYSLHTWHSNLGNEALVDTWKYIYNEELTKTIIIGDSCQETGGSISGYVYEDSNHNNIKDLGETGIPNVSVVLKNTDTNECQSLKTDGIGYYIFENINEGNYQIIESNSELAPIPNDCSNITEEDPFGYISVSSNIINLNFNEKNGFYKNFADFKGSKVMGKTFEDNGINSGISHDSIINGEEVLISDSFVSLYENNNLIEAMYTNAEGLFEFWIPDTYSSLKLVAEKSNYINISTNESNLNLINKNLSEINFNNSAGIINNVLFGFIKEPAFKPSLGKVTQAGSSVVYNHTLELNTSGNVYFSLEEVNKNPSGLIISPIIYRDDNCNNIIDTGENVINFNDSFPVNIDLNNKTCLNIKVITPVNTPNNSNYSFKINAHIDYLNVSLNNVVEIIDILTITAYGNNSNLTLIKSVDKATAAPNEVLSYIINVKNNSQETLDNIVVNDFTPAFTNFFEALCPVSLPTGMISCIINSPNIGEEGDIKWIFNGVLNSGEEFDLVYRVKVNN